MSPAALQGRIEQLRAASDGRPAVLVVLLMAESRRLYDAGEPAAAGVMVNGAADLAAHWVQQSQLRSLEALWEAPAAGEAP